MAIIEYIGKKAVKPDNVAGTNTVWNGTGDRQEVSDPAAVAKLLEYPDVWVLVGGKEAIEQVLEEVTASTKKPTGKYDVEEVEDVAVRVDVNRLAKQPLVAYAKRTFGVDLDATKTLVDLRSTVARLVAKDGSITRNVRSASKGTPAKPVAKSSKSAKKK